LNGRSRLDSPGHRAAELDIMNMKKEVEKEKD
jgi:hypothetical protein